MSLQSSAILLVGPVLGVLDHTPARLELQVSPTVELQSYHGKTQKYTIPIDDITEVQVYSSAGGQAGSRPRFGALLAGFFVMVHDGTVHLCLDPTAGKFLRVETEDGIFWFTGETDEKTRKSPNGLLKRWGRLPIDIFAPPACGELCSPCHPKTQANCKKMLQISHQKAGLPLTALL